MMRISKAQFLEIGDELFGTDMRLWRFRCPACKHEQSVAEVLARNPSLGDPSDWIYFNCEGRYTAGVGCDWTLGGLFQIHTLEVYNQKGERSRTFEFAHERAATLIEQAALKFVKPTPAPAPVAPEAE
jgi:hypothetical protein